MLDCLRRLSDIIGDFGGDWDGGGQATNEDNKMRVLRPGELTDQFLSVGEMVRVRVKLGAWHVVRLPKEIIGRVMRPHEPFDDNGVGL